MARHDDKLAETGRLGGEAVIDSGTVTLAVKMVSDRQRPLQGNGQGHFWVGGTGNWQLDSSFPSDHATASMALARVIAGEYPRWYVVASAYSFAEAISVARILANQHFPSDVVVGQAIGFLTGTYVLNHRAQYRGKKRSVITRALNAVISVANPQTRTFGIAFNVPFKP